MNPPALGTATLAVGDSTTVEVTMTQVIHYDDCWISSGVINGNPGAELNGKRATWPVGPAGIVVSVLVENDPVNIGIRDALWVPGRSSASIVIKGPA